MGRTVDYYFAPQSPWAYLGHQRLADIVQRTGATVRVMPIDLGGKVFPISGGLPLGQRAPQRLAYRLVELQRFSQHLNVPLNLKPKYFPVGGELTSGKPDRKQGLYFGEELGAEDAFVEGGGRLGGVVPEGADVALVLEDMVRLWKAEDTAINPDDLQQWWDQIGVWRQKNSLGFIGN